MFYEGGDAWLGGGKEPGVVPLQSRMQLTWVQVGCHLLRNFFIVIIIQP